MTDKMTPGQLRDLADIIDAIPSGEYGGPHFREEAARREAEQLDPVGTASLAASLAQSKDKPAPAADEIAASILALEHRDPCYPTPHPRCVTVAEFIRAQALRIGRLEADLQYTAKGHDDLLAENARLREALERLSWLTPNAANARSAGELYHTVKAIADTALARGGDQ